MKKEVSWRKSKGKLLLYKGLRNGEISLGKAMNARQVIALHSEFGGSDKDSVKRFSVRLNNARKIVQASITKAAADKVVIEHDIRVFQLKNSTKNSTTRVWYSSKAAMLLQIDIANELHKTMKPVDLYNSRSEYSEFNLHTFRRRVYQAIRTRKFRDQYQSRKTASVAQP